MRTSGFLLNICRNNLILVIFLPLITFAQIQPDQKIPYKITQQDTLRLHYFSPDTETPRAAVVFFFGGGWVQGNPGQFYHHCEHLAAQGIAAFSAEYRVKSRHGTTPFECVKDGKSAVRWLKEHADEFGFEPEHVIAAGGSAGGHVAACTALIEAVNEASDNLQVSSLPAAMVLFNPVIDTSERGYGYDRLGERFAEISPVHHVRASLPPTLIFHGTADTTVPFENIQRFCDAMQGHDNRCEIIAFEDKGHAFFNYGRDDNKPYRKTIAEMDRFLAELGFLP